MEVADAQAQALRAAEAAAGGVHADRRRGKRIVGWKVKSSPILTAFVGGAGWAGEDVVPFEDVAFAGVGGDEGWRVGGDGGVFAGEAFVGRAGGHGCWCECGEG